MPNYVMLQYTRLARGRTVGVLLDLHTPEPVNCRVGAAYNGKMYYLSEYLERSWAFDHAEELELCFSGPEGPCDWKTVWARATERPEEPGRWRESPAEVASRLFPLGSWNWLVVTLMTKPRLPGPAQPN
jgi:hypothetical protein